MKTLISLFSIVLCLSYGKAQWVELDTGMENPPVFNDVYAITPDIVVVVGANGTILKTTDGGETWVQKPSGTSVNLGKVQFPTQDIGYVTGADGKLLKTIDSGETWTTIDLGETTILNSLSCVNESLIFISCIITGFGNRLLKSEDGGETWDNSNELPFYGDIQFVSDEIGFAWESFGSTLTKTENGGGWNEITGLAVGPAHFLDEEVGFCYNGSLLKTTDGGDNFVDLGFGNAGLLFDIFVVNENNIWGIIPGELGWDPTSHGIVNITSPDTENYTEIIAWEYNDEIDMFSIHFADETTGYIVGYKQGMATIWKNGTGINTMGSKEYLKNMIRIYPNPTFKEINISFNPSFSGILTLTDLTGKQVHYQKFANKDKIKIDVKKLLKGIYILTIDNQQERYSQKIIIN